MKKEFNNPNIEIILFEDMETIKTDGFGDSQPGDVGVDMGEILGENGLAN